MLFLAFVDERKEKRREGRKEKREELFDLWGVAVQLALLRCVADGLGLIRWGLDKRPKPRNT